MSFFCTSTTTTQPTTSVQTQQIPAWYEEAIQRLVGAGEAETAARPYQYYAPEERVAQLSPTEEATIAQTPMAAGAYMPGLSSAYQSAAMGSRGVGDVDYSQYMNPYTQYVTDIAKREALRDYGKMLPQMGFQASRQGAFGGARYGVQEAEAERNLGQRLSDIQTMGLEKAFTAGTNLQQQEAQRQLQASQLFGNIGEQAQRLGLSGLDAVMKSQALPRQLEQQQRDLAYQEYLRGQQYGMGQLGQLSGIIRGVQPGGTTTTQQQTLVPQMSPLQMGAGLGLTGASIYNLLGYAK